MNQHTPPPAKGATIGHNQPADIVARLQDDHAELAAHCRDLITRANSLPATVETEEHLHLVADFVREVNNATKRAEKIRVDEKEPYLSAERAVDGFFNGLRNPLLKIKGALESAAGAYQRRKEAEERRQREEAARIAREKAEAEAREARRLAEEQRRAEADAAKDRAKEAAINARAATRATEAKPADLVRTRTETGTMATAKSWWDFEITDARELDLESLRPFIPKAALEQALRGFIAAGGREIAGARIFEETKAVFR